MTTTISSPPAPVDSASVSGADYLRQAHARERRLTAMATYWQRVAAEQQRFIGRTRTLLEQAPLMDGANLAFLNTLRSELARAAHVQVEAPDGAW